MYIQDRLINENEKISMTKIMIGTPKKTFEILKKHGLHLKRV